MGLPIYFGVSSSGISLIQEWDRHNAVPLHCSFLLLLWLVWRIPVKIEVLLVALPVIIIILINPGGVAYIIQSYLFIFFIVAFGKMSSRELDRVSTGAVWGLSIFLLFHTVSILYSDGLIFVVNKHNFTTVFGFFIYQGLISYPAVIALLLVLIRTTPLPDFIKMVVILLSVYILLLGARKASYILLAFYCLLYHRIFFILILLAAVFAFVTFGLTVNDFLVFDRLLYMKETGQMAAGRPEQWADSFQLIFFDAKNFLVGSTDYTINPHNYTLTIFRNGGVIMFFSMFVLWYIYIVQHFKKILAHQKLTVFYVFAYVVVDANINSPFTQMYVGSFFSLLFVKLKKDAEWSAILRVYCHPQVNKSVIF